VELVGVAGCDCQAVGEGGGRDPKVVSADHVPAVRELSPHVGVNTRDVLGDRDRVQLGERSP
jgi:hypothetical protein